ncbi:MAG: hypothetical protein ACI9P3_004447 [Bradyrhizobium sp.]|jgi:hypothetical protein
MLTHIVHSLCSGSPVAATLRRQNRQKTDEFALNSGPSGDPFAAADMAATHIPLSENICRQYDNDAGRKPKLGLSRAAQRIGFALWVIAYGALARHPSPFATGSH